MSFGVDGGACPVSETEAMNQTGWMEDFRSMLPSGTVTFLLTDVEGSTRLWQERSGEMPAAVARHDAILAAAIAENGGVRPLEQGEGDSVVGAFAYAAGALAAAVAAQRALQTELPWLRVRMAVHTGDALVKDGVNYAGMTIIRCARLRACGHGGQILVSSATAALVDELAEVATLVELGTVRLRDVARVERVWQVHHPALWADFEPLLSLEAAPSNLPAPLTSFIGRTGELATLTELVSLTRLLTVAGSGGCGKTRVVMELAAQLGDGFTGGTWWVALAPVSDAAALADVIGAAMNFVPSPGTDPLAQVVRRLAGRGPTLLLLDNAEHLLDATSTAVEAILGGCSEITVVVTSREPLGISGETVWRVPSLSIPARGACVEPADVEKFDAIRLFVERAREARPHLRIDRDTVTSIADICARLDGIPLALELAAARVRSMPIDRLADGLRDAFQLLTGGSRSAMPRQQTLLASIAWSTDLLDPFQAAVLWRLAVFHGSFTVEAAEAVAADGVTVETFDVFDAIAALVDKSLLQFDDDAGRYRMLETIRQYGLDRLRDAGELLDTRRRHASRCVAWCREVGTGIHGTTSEQWRHELPDVAAATEWGYDNDPLVVYAITRHFAWPQIGFNVGPQTDRLYEWMAHREPSEHPREWAEAMAGLCPSAFGQLRFDFLDEARTLPAKLEHDPAASFMVRSSLALVSWFTAFDGTALLDCAREALERDDALAIPQIVGQAIGVPFRQHADFDTADELEAALMAAIARQGLPYTCDTARQGHWLSVEMATVRGDLHRARQLLGPTPNDNVMVFSSALCGALLAAAAHDLDLADDMLRWVDREPSTLMASVPPTILGLRAAIVGDHDTATDHLLQNWEAVRWSQPGSLNSAPWLVTQLIAADRIGEARHVVDEVESYSRATADYELPQAYIAQCRALIDIAEERWSSAADAAHRLLTLAHTHGLALLRIDALEMIGLVAATRTSNQTAARLLAAAAAARDSIGYRHHMIGDPAAFQTLIANLAETEPDAWEQGAALTIDAAIELAQRKRGRRGRPTTGWEALTPTERSVADLAASGESNQAIATRLIMGPTTVKTHISRVFTKLGVSNRTQLAALAARLPEATRH